MKKLNLIALSVVSLAFSIQACSATTETDWYKVTTENKPATRWWWHGSAVDKENLSWNLEQYSKAGIGGVEITPIYGVIDNEANDIEYLSPKWMEMYKHTVAEAKRNGMFVDLNNGTGWPFGGPNVTDEHAAKRVYIQEFKAPFTQKIAATESARRSRGKDNSGSAIKEVDDATLLCLMAYSDKGDKIDITDKVGADKTLNWKAPSEGWTLHGIFIGKTKQVVKRAAPGGEGLVVDHFTKSSFEYYLKRFDEAFKASNAPMPRAFFNDSYEVYGADWSPTLLAEFEKAHGYKLQEYIPEFQANGTSDISRRIISDYRQTMSEILTDNFIIPWENWAHNRGAIIKNQSHGSPANIVDVYASVDIPECESYGRTQFDIPEIRVDSGMKTNDSNPMVLKFASSGANISGKKYISSETFTWLTEHFRTSLSQCKPEIDLMFASGVNHVFFHGTPYSPKEAAWPGWRFYASVHMAPTDAQWENSDAFFSYITRTQSFLQAGKSDNDFLLYFPVYDIWNDYRERQYIAFSIHGLIEMLPEFNKAVLDIKAGGYDVDYVSDKFIASLTLNKDNELVTSGGAAYKALVLPSSKLIKKETLAKIIELAKAGAKVVFTERFPNDVPGFGGLEKRRDEIKPILAELPTADFTKTQVHKIGKGEIITGADLRSVLPATEVASESFGKEFGGQYIRRKYDLGNIYFFTMLQNKSVDGWVTLGKNAQSVMIFDPMTGEKGLAKTREMNGKTQVYLQMKPCESLILKTFAKKGAKAQVWNYLSTEDNAIDINKGWSLSFPKSDPEIQGTFNIDTLGSWCNLDIPNAKINVGTGLYKVEFDMPKDANTIDEWVLNLGDLRESAVVRMNGQNVGKVWAIPYKINVGKFIKNGKNTLEIEVTNLAANRIADYDSRDVNWRIFKNINVVSISYNPIKLNVYPIAESGLLGKVTLTPMKYRTEF